MSFYARIAVRARGGGRKWRRIVINVVNAEEKAVLPWSAQTRKDSCSTVLEMGLIRGGKGGDMRVCGKGFVVEVAFGTGVSSFFQ